MKPIHWILTFALFIASHVSFAQESVFPDTNFLKQEYARQQAIKAEMDKLQAIQLKYQQDKKNTSSEKSTFTSLPVHWEERGPTGMPNGINQILIDANDPTGKKAWAATWGGLWYNNDITADSSWHLTEIDIPVYSIAQNPVNPLEIIFSDFNTLFGISSNGGISWAIKSDFQASDLIYNNNGDLFSGCLNICGPSDRLFRLNRAQMRFELFLNIRTLLPGEINPLFSDIKFDHENLIYLALSNGKVYRSSSEFGGSWVNIMNANLSINSSKTYLGISKDSGGNKFIYAINLKFNHGWTENINWIRKSSNGGQSWINVSIPSINSYQIQIPNLAFMLVNPLNPSEIALGGLNANSSSDGGITWKTTTENYIPNISFVNNRLWNKFYLVYEDWIMQINNLFGTGNISMEKRIKDLNTTGVSYFGFRNEYKDSVFFVNSKKVKGNDVLVPFDNYENHWQSFIDGNETDIHFSFTPSLTYYDREGNSNKKFAVTINNIFGPKCYDEKNNVAYGVQNSDQINNRTTLFRVKNIGETNEILDEIFINRYLNIFEIDVLNDSSLIAINFNEIEQKFDIYRVSVDSDDSGSLRLLDSSNIYTSRLVVDRNNPNLIFVQRNGLEFSQDGGLSWINKTSSINGRIQSYINNPNNPDIVFITTSEKRIFKTTNFKSNSLTWLDITGDIYDNVVYDLGYLFYREADASLWVSNVYRGLFNTNFLQNTVSNQIIIANYPKINCFNNQIKVTFYKNGEFSQSNSYELWLSDINGNFTNATKIGISNTSPIYGTFPENSIPGSNYRFRVVSTNQSYPIIYADSGPIELQKGTDVFLPGYPKVINPTKNGFVINAPVIQNAEIRYVIVKAGNSRPNQSQIISGLDASGIPYYSSGSSLSEASDSNPFFITDLISGTSYDIYLISRLIDEECYSEIIKLTVSTTGVQPLYCIPESINGCSGDYYVSEVSLLNYDNGKRTFLSKFNSGCGINSYNLNSEQIESIKVGTFNKIISLKIHDFQGSFPTRKIGIWIDFNDDGDFTDQYENIANSIIQNNFTSNNLYLDPSVNPGIKRMRIRVVNGTDPAYSTHPCITYDAGETEDYFIKIEPNQPHIFTNLDKDYVGQCETIKVLVKVTDSNFVGNAFRLELSSPTGSFANSTTIHSGFTLDNPIVIQVPKSLPNGFEYKLRIVSDNPSAVSYESPSFIIGPKNLHISTNFSTGLNDFSNLNSISANNKNTDTAKVILKAWNSVLILPNFEAKPSSSGSFKAEIVGCDN